MFGTHLDKHKDIQLFSKFNLTMWYVKCFLFVACFCIVLLFNGFKYKENLVSFIVVF